MAAATATANPAEFAASDRKRALDMPVSVEDAARTTLVTEPGGELELGLGPLWGRR